MATFGWSYTKNFSGSKRPHLESRKVQEWQTNRAVTVRRQALHPQSHSAETVTAGKKFRCLCFADDHSARLYVGNLSVDTNEVMLAQHFSTFGELIDAKIIKNHASGSSRGFGFVTFDCVQDAEEAKKWFAYNHLKINGREIIVKTAERRNPSKGKEVAEKKNITRDVRSGLTLHWEYKWTKDHNAQVYGPYETNLMLQWSKYGYFDSGCWVRRVDPQALTREGQGESTDDQQVIVRGGEGKQSTDDQQVIVKGRERKQSDDPQVIVRGGEGKQSTDDSHVIVRGGEGKQPIDYQQVIVRGGEIKQTTDDPQEIVRGGEGKQSTDNSHVIVRGGYGKESTDATQSKKLELTLDYSESSSDSENDTACMQLANGRVDGDDYSYDYDQDEGDDDCDDSNDNTQSTEFVHVSEIDFSFFP